MLDFLLLVHIGIPLGYAELFFFDGIVGIVAGKYGGTSVVDFNDFGSQPVQEEAVMGND